jgi:hypothetical protein
VDELVRCALQDGLHPPWACVCITKLVDDAAFSIRTNCTSSKDDVANRVLVGVRTARVDKFSMVRTLFLHEKLCDLATCRQASGKFLGI